MPREYSKSDDYPDELDYTTRIDGSAAIMKEIDHIVFVARMKNLIPHIAKELTRLGVDFSKVNMDEVITITESEISEALRAI